MLGVRVLGDVGVTVDGKRYEVAAPRQQAILAMLALDANRAVGAGSLIEGIWGETLPVHPEAALHVVVSRLRASLGPAAARVVSGQGAYRLDVSDSELDIAAALQHFLRAETWMREHEPVRAVAEVNAALSSWSADPFCYLVAFPCYERASTRVRELWAALYSLRIDALIAAGRHVEVLATIDAWIVDAPWDERRRAQQMLALYLAGRQVDALRVYEDFRGLLLEELGIDPTVELRNLHQCILHHDASLLPRGIGLVSALPPWTSLRLPFVGRSFEEEQILDRLRVVAEGGRGMIIVEGEPGIGKTRLALEIARRVQDDTVLLTATGNDARYPAMSVIANGLANVLFQLDDAELRMCVGRWPADLATIAPRLRERLPDLGPPIEGEPQLRAERVRAALVSCISALSRRAPVLLVVDDLHRAGPELLLLLGYLLADGSQPRVGVLATARTTAPDRSSRLAHLATRLEEQGLLERVTLTGLDLSAVTRLLAERRVPGLMANAAALHAVTGGQPFFLGEMLDSDEARTGAFDDLPSSVHDFVRHRARALGSAEEHLLADVSAFLTAFDIPIAAAIVGSNEATTAHLVQRAVDAHILRSIGLSGFTFAHEVTRRALAETLTDERRAELNRRIAVALEAAGEPAALIASHWRYADGPEAVEKMIDFAGKAGEEAMARHDPGAACRWFEIAYDAASDPAVCARILVRLSDAQSLAGDAAADDSLRNAIAIARELENKELLIACATSWTPTWSSGLPFEWPERVQLLEEGAAAATNDSDRALLLGRLATEMLYTADARRARPIADAALACAEASGDRATRIEVHLRHFDATWSPHFLDARRAQIATTLRLAGDADVVDRCFALSRAAAVAIESVDLARADERLEQLFELGDRHDLSVVTHCVTSIRAWRVALAGDLDGAERLIKQADRLGVAAKLHNASFGSAAQLFCLTWQKGEFADLLPVLELSTGDDRDRAPFRIMHSRALAGAGRNDDARAALALVTEADLENLPKDPLWSMVLLAAAEAAYMVGAADTARVVHRLLVPFASRVAFARNWVVAPIAFGAGIASAAASCADTDALFAQALEIAERLEAPVLRARVAIGWATTGLTRSPDEINQARIQACADYTPVVNEERHLDRLSESAVDLAVLVSG